MKKITYGELVKAMREHNKQEHPDEITAVIVYKQSNWEKLYTVKERSYRVSNHNRYFEDGKISNSVFGDCLDGTDRGVRLDWYRWDVEYCYFE